MTQKALKRRDTNALRIMFKKRGIKSVSSTGRNVGSPIKRDRKYSEKISSKKPMDEESLLQSLRDQINQLSTEVGDLSKITPKILGKRRSRKNRSALTNRKRTLNVTGVRRRKR
jgi:uncharacterized protein YlxW (UPF0749 family)